MLSFGYTARAKAAYTGYSAVAPSSRGSLFRPSSTASSSTATRSYAPSGSAAFIYVIFSDTVGMLSTVLSCHAWMPHISTVIPAAQASGINTAFFLSTPHSAQAIAINISAYSTVNAER